MPILACKFGGSSTADAERFRQIKAILDSDPSRRCAVLSAPGTDEAHPDKVTALLSSCWRTRRDRRARKKAVDAVARRFDEIASELDIEGFYDVAKDEIDAALRDSEAQALSRGEYLCALLFSRYSGIPMADAADVIAFDEGGGVNMERTLGALIALSRTRDRVVLPGFYGAEPSGRVRVFPRNGSDITGALAAVGLGATVYENWTDVPGLMTADPAIVPGARRIDRVGYAQMRALSRAGAQVLHPACLDPVERAGIPTRLRCTMEPDGPGTLIDGRVAEIAPCLAGKREAALPVRARGEDAVASCVSVFGFPFRRVLAEAELLGPIVVEPASDCARVYVEPQAYEMALRALHRRLLE